MRALLCLTLAATACGTADAQDALPDSPEAIHAWLVTGQYEDWDAESRPFEALNGAKRRVYLNDLVEPTGSRLGAAAVREMWDRDETARLGWSFIQKVDDRGRPDDWLFFETFSLDDPNDYSVFARGAPSCVGCHSAAPDIVQSETPLP